MKIKNEEKASGISKEGGHGESGDHKEKERGWKRKFCGLQTTQEKTLCCKWDRGLPAGKERKRKTGEGRRDWAKEGSVGAWTKKKHNDVLQVLQQQQQQQQMQAFAMLFQQQQQAELFLKLFEKLEKSIFFIFLSWWRTCHLILPNNHEKQNILWLCQCNLVVVLLWDIFMPVINSFGWQ